MVQCALQSFGVSNCSRRSAYVYASRSFGETLARLIAPVHAPELVHVEIAGARATLEGRFAGLDHLPPLSEGFVRTVADAALRFIVRTQLLVRQPQLPVLIMNQQNARREDRQPVVHPGRTTLIELLI
jgi:hypothetical protein